MSDSPIVIRKLEKKDLGKATRFVSRMMRWTAKTHSKGGYSRESLDHFISTATRTLDLALKDPSHYCILALKGREISGIVLGQVLGGVSRIDWLAVSPESHRQGIGKKLVAAVESQMRKRGCHKVTLFISNSHIPAIGLYLKWGMVPEGSLKQHLWGGDYIVMSKWLERKI